ncbi:MAG: adenosylcobinamide-GDP ribazoletransferase [Terracidiphilus sp.]
MNSIFQDFAAAFQFLTRLPLNWLPYRPDALSRAARFFPLVGLALGAADAGIYLALAPHLSLAFIALLIVLFSTLITGGLHEDGLADVADGLGGGWNKEKALAIMKDSRVGSYGALAIVFSVVGRMLLLAHLPAADFVSYAISAEVLCRWTVLPLGRALPGAGEQAGQGARLARRISVPSLLIGTLFALVIVGSLLRWSMWKPVVAAAAVTLLSGLYYKKRIGGITGDCFGATIQLALVAVYLCGVWKP